MDRVKNVIFLTPVAKLDAACLAVDKLYRKYPILLKAQAFISLLLSMLLLNILKLGAIWYEEAPKIFHYVVWVVAFIYYSGFVIFLAKVERQPFEQQAWMPPYLRPILQWVVVEVVKNLVSVAEDASHLADWPSTIRVLVMIYYIITFTKLLRKLNDFRAIDGLISVLRDLRDGALGKKTLGSKSS